jgi:RNA polymerase sigma-70 factor, ECF subfamily
MIRPQPAAGVQAAGVPDFETLYAAHFQSLTLQLFAYTNDLDQAEDVVQEAFCRALSRWSRLSAYDDPVSWVRHVAWNLATSRWRELRRLKSLFRHHTAEYGPEPSPDHVALTAALATLPAHHRRAVVMYHLADMSIGEIARHEGIAAGTVKSWLHRGRTALAAALGNSPEEATNARNV